MKVLHVTQNYFPSVGGPQYAMQHISEKLVAYYGDTVEVCTTNSLYGPETKLFKKIEPAVEIINHVTINRLPFNRWQYPFITFLNKVHAKLTGRPLPYSITKYRWGLYSPAVDRAMTDTKADVIMATTILYNFADYPLWRFTTKNPKPFILFGAVHLHKALPENSPFITRAKACDYYIANTEFERQELIKYGVGKEKIETIGIGIEAADFICDETKIAEFKNKNGIEEDDIVIGFIGRLVKGKGVAILIDAFRKLYAENKKVKLLLAGGTTDYVPQIEKLIKDENLPVILIKDFDEKQKPLLYYVLDIFVLASQSESFGIVFLEAWICKKPVIGTRIGAIASLLTEGEDSLLFTAGDTDNLYDKLKTLTENKELRKQLGSAGYKKVMQHFTWPVIILKYRNAYIKGIENFKRKNKAYGLYKV